MASNAHRTRMMIDEEDNNYAYGDVSHIRIMEEEEEEEEEIQTLNHYSCSY